MKNNCVCVKKENCKKNPGYWKGPRKCDVFKDLKGLQSTYQGLNFEENFPKLRISLMLSNFYTCWKEIAHKPKRIYKEKKRNVFRNSTNWLRREKCSDFDETNIQNVFKKNHQNVLNFKNSGG